MKKLLGVLFIVAGVCGGLYVGGWVMFIQPIIAVCQSFDSGTLTGMIVGFTVLKCLFASFVGGAIFYIGVLIGNLLLFETHTKKRRR